MHNTSVDDVQRTLDNAVRRIHEDLDKTAEARNRLVREVYSQARTQLEQDVEAERERIEEDLRVARREAFAPPILEGCRIDDAFVAKWYHEEIEKLKDERESQKVMEMLQEAVLFNNLPKAKAILCKGYQMGNSEIVRRYLENFPDEQQAWDNLVEASEAYNQFEKVQHMFSAGSRLRPIEAYLA